MSANLSLNTINRNMEELEASAVQVLWKKLLITLRLIPLWVLVALRAPYPKHLGWWVLREISRRCHSDL